MQTSKQCCHRPLHGAHRHQTHPRRLATAYHAAAALICSPRRCIKAAARPSSDGVDEGTDEQPRQLYGSFATPPPAAPLPEKRVRPCGRCGGAATVACATCSGAGRLRRGGFNKRNPLNMDKIMGSKWTAMERTLGWRHFRVTQKRREGRDAYVLLVATCDEDTQLWVNAKNLKERERWAPGWLQKAELARLEELGPRCKECGGSGSLPCPVCSQAGRVVDL